MRYIAIIILLSGCSANWYANMAIKKGAKIQTDTLFIDVITKETKTDTIALISQVTKRDTIFLTSAKWLTKTLIRKDTIWQEVTCLPDTIRVPFKVETTITAKPKKPWYLPVLYVLSGIGLLTIVLSIRKRL